MAVTTMNSDSDMRFTGHEYSTMLDWMMTSDPWPLSELKRDRMVEMLNEEARARGYSDWTEAYHDFHMNEAIGQ